MLTLFFKEISPEVNFIFKQKKKKTQELFADFDN